MCSKNYWVGLKFRFERPSFYVFGMKGKIALNREIFYHNFNTSYTVSSFVGLTSVVEFEVEKNTLLKFNQAVLHCAKFKVFS